MSTVGFLYMLMAAVSISDMDVERAVQVNGAASYEDCREMLTTYSDDRHYFCQPVVYDIQPLDRDKLMEEYYDATH